MKMETVNPKKGVYPATKDYVHAMKVTGAASMLFISGTMGLDETGLAPKTIDEQLSLVWSNIRCILANAEMNTDNIVRTTSYLRDTKYAKKNENARVAALEGRRIPTTTIVAETLTPKWLIEIEVIAAV
ncbi:RidA family protein [Amylibacter sp. SFDW26]|uniref:RidA family protein n=1 Tax=Amylibacter sp. SFDW26 TaxID=2652722 RepID=UPI001262848C|nr:RidA family protein [Amylibacter sp. SFDW26]KAB7614302.1 RidA family protein [Amylibacter sp. SFDW26]